MRAIFIGLSPVGGERADAASNLAACALKPSRQTEQKLQCRKMSIAQPAAATPRKESVDSLRGASAVAATGGGRLNIAKLHSF